MLISKLYYQIWWSRDNYAQCWSEHNKISPFIFIVKTKLQTFLWYFKITECHLILRNWLLFISLINEKFWDDDVYICSIQIYGKLLEYVLSVRNDALHGPEFVELIFIKVGGDTWNTVKLFPQFEIDSKIKNWSLNLIKFSNHQ